MDRGLAGSAPSWSYEERLFQAARFVTEMEYQHLAFEEFIRKVQPMVSLFGEAGTGYHTEINPAIRAEFAHAVYRFGHSMLSETVDRTDPLGVDEQHRLARRLPQPAGALRRHRRAVASRDHGCRTAVGNIVRGMTRQVGNELDEFVTDAVRNRLLGLPLDLATLNMARARDTGIPGLNAARRAFFAESQNPALVPYASWADLGFSLQAPRIAGQLHRRLRHAPVDRGSGAGHDRQARRRAGTSSTRPTRAHRWVARAGRL